MAPRQLEYGRSRSLHRLRAARKPVNDLVGKGQTGHTGGAFAADNPPFCVGGDQAFKGGIEEVTVEHGGGQDVHREGQRVHAHAQAGHAQPPRFACDGQLAVEGPAIVVERAAEVPVVLAGGEEFLAELAGHRPPQAEVVLLRGGVSPAGWKIPTGMTWYRPPAWVTLAGSRRCSKNDASPAAARRRVRVVIAGIALRRDRSQGSPISSRSGKPSAPAGCGPERWEASS